MTTATIEERIAQCEPQLDSPHGSIRAQYEEYVRYYQALQDADHEGQRIPALVLFDVLVTDEEWTEQTLLENLPDYVLSALQDADREEQRHSDDQAYMLDLTDGTVYLPTPEVLAAIRSLDEIPASTTSKSYLVLDAGAPIGLPQWSKSMALQDRNDRRARYKPEYHDRVQVVEISIVED